MSETKQTVWRDGERIRRTDGTGYADFVTDEKIREHLDAHRWHLHGDGDADVDPLFVPFAEAVLAIRAFEREASR